MSNSAIDTTNTLDEDRMYLLQAKYLELINKKAKAQYEVIKTAGITLPVDPQGRILFDVKVSDDELLALCRENLFKKDFKALRNSLNEDTNLRTIIKEYLGHRVTDTTTVSYELPKNNDTKYEFLKGLQPNVKTAYQKIPSSRIISLQHENYCHAHLIGRTIKDTIRDSKNNAPLSDLEVKALVDSALWQLHRKEKTIFKRAIEDAYNASLNDGKLNQETFALNVDNELDKARVELLPKISEVIKEALIANDIGFDEDKFVKISQHAAESNTASINDVVHLHPSLGKASFIGGSEKTAHDKEIGDETTIAHRLNYSHQLTANDEVKVLTKRRHIRAPSIAIKDGDFKEAIADVANKISGLQEEYNLGQNNELNLYEAINWKQKAFHYNLLTSLDSTDGSNKQIESAKRILLGAHKYNKKNPKKPKCFVQNISVNGWGWELGLEPLNRSFAKEATLMAKLATLHTVYDELTDEAQHHARNLFNTYDNFLATQEHDTDYFYQYVERFSKVQDLFKNIDKQLVCKPLGESTAPESELDSYETKRNQVKSALINAFNEGKYADKSYGFTYQALSIFAEKDSFGGCKSANERFSAVYGRVAMLDFITIDKKIRNKLLGDYLGDNAGNVISKVNALESAIEKGEPENIKKTLNDCYQQLGIEGFQNLISYLDQGGHSKLGTKTKKPNTNNCEQVKVSVKNADKAQAHKGMMKNVFKTFGQKRFSFNRKEEIKYYKHLSQGFAATGAIIGMATSVINTGIASSIGVGLGLAALSFPPTALFVAGLIITALAGAAIGYSPTKVIGNYLIKDAEKKYEAANEKNNIAGLQNAMSQQLDDGTAESYKEKYEQFKGIQNGLNDSAKQHRTDSISGQAATFFGSRQKSGETNEATKDVEHQDDESIFSNWLSGIWP